MKKNASVQNHSGDSLLMNAYETIHHGIWHQTFSQVFIITVLMIGHLSCVELMGDPGYQVLEFYAGQRRAARLASGLGQNCAAMDIMYDPQGDNKKVNNCMDMNTSAGFTLPFCSLCLGGFDRRKILYPTQLMPFKEFSQAEIHQSCSCSLTIFELRLACILVLQARWDEFLALFGICCSTYVSISRGSTKRSIFLPMGCPISLANYRANKGTARLGNKKTGDGWFGFHLGCSSVRLLCYDGYPFKLSMLHVSPEGQCWWFCSLSLLVGYL